MADLSSLMSVSPLTASYFAGQNQAQDTQMNDLKQKELAELIQQRMAQAQRESAMAPLMQQHQDLQNQGLQAGLGSITAKSQLDTQKATAGAATFDSDVAAQKATNQKTIDDATYKKFENGQKALLESGPILAQTPPALRSSVFRAQLEAAGMNPDSKQFQSIMSLDPNQMPQAIQQLAKRAGEQLLTMNPAAQASIQGAQIHAGSAVESARIHAGATTEAARIGADSRLDIQRSKTNDKLNSAANTLTLLKNGKIPPDRALMAAKVNIMDAATDQEKAIWTEIGTFAEQALQNKAQYGHEGDLAVTPKPGGGMGLTPKAVQPLFGGGKPKGTGTKDDPIKLD